MIQQQKGNQIYIHIYIYIYYVIQNCKHKSLGIHTWVCESVYPQKTATLFLTLTNILVII